MDNDMKETGDEIAESQYPITSVTVRGYYKGFSLLATARDPKTPLGPLVQKGMDAIDWMIEKGFQPSWNKQTNGEINKAKEPELKTKGCPECGGTMIYKTGVSKAGKKYAGWFCEENNTHVEWINLNKK